MQRIYMLVAGLAILAFAGFAQPGPAGPYKVVKTVKVGGAGGYDYVYADVDGRRLYIPRPGGSGARIIVFDLDSLAPVGEIPNANARGVAVDPKSHHGFGSSKPVVMWDTRTLATIKTINVDGAPDGILFDPFNERVYIFSHSRALRHRDRCQEWIGSGHDRPRWRPGAGSHRRQGPYLRQHRRQGQHRGRGRQDPQGDGAL